jgi:hypothetical protein
MRPPLPESAQIRHCRKSAAPPYFTIYARACQALLICVKPEQISRDNAGTLRRGAGFGILWSSMLPMAAICVALFALGLMRFRRPFA